MAVTVMTMIDRPTAAAIAVWHDDRQFDCIGYQEGQRCCIDTLLEENAPMEQETRRIVIELHADDFALLEQHAKLSRRTPQHQAATFVEDALRAFAQGATSTHPNPYLQGNWTEGRNSPTNPPLPQGFHGLRQMLGHPSTSVPPVYGDPAQLNREGVLNEIVMTDDEAEPS